MKDVTIRTTTEDDWEAVRNLRLEMIRDTPHGFAERLEDAQRQDEQEWRLRGKRGDTENSTSIVAIDEAGTWVGAMGGWIPNPAVGPLLVGVYIAPSHRGRSAGVTDRMLDVIEAWAGTHAATLRLTVHEQTKPARTSVLPAARLRSNGNRYPLRPRPRSARTRDDPHTHPMRTP